MPEIPAHHEISLHIGNRLKAARKLRKYSQADFGNALAIPITFQQIQKYEKGKNHINIVRLLEFARVLKLPISYFTEGLDSTEAQPLMQNDEIAFLEAYRTFDHTTRERIYKFIVGLSRTKQFRME